MSDPNLILKDTGSMEQTNNLVCMYAETVFHDEQTLRLISALQFPGSDAIFIDPRFFVFKSVNERFLTEKQSRSYFEFDKNKLKLVEIYYVLKNS